MRGIWIILASLAWAMFAADALASPAGDASPETRPGLNAEATTTARIMDGFDRNYTAARDMLAQPLQDYSNERLAELNALRVTMAADRDRADALASRGTIPSRVVDAQIDALGPPPEEGESEPASISARREQLRERLGEIEAPLIRVREARARAAVMVDELDSRIRRLQNRQKFERGYSPLNPALWAQTFRDIGAGWSAMATQFSVTKARYGGTEIALAAALALGLLALIPLLVIGLRRRMFRWLDRRLDASKTMARRMILTLSRDSMSGFVLLVAAVIGAVALAVLGALVVAVARLLPVFIALVLGGFIVATGEWLGRSSLRSPFPELRLLTLPPEKTDGGIALIRRMSELLAAEIVIDALEQGALISTSISRLLSAVVVIVGAWLVWQLALLFRDARRNEHEKRTATMTQEERERGRIDFATPIARLIRVVAIAAVVITLVGFVLLAREIFTSTLLTLGLLGTAIYTHRIIAMMVRAAAAGPFRQYRRILHFVPLAVGFGLVILLLPLIAIIWGYSANEIGDGILALRNGVDFGEVRISFGDVMTFIAVFLIGFFVTRWLQRFLDVAILPEFGMERGVQSALVTGIGYIGVVMAAVVAIASTGLDLSSLAFVAGALSVGLGFGLQAVIENFTSGILLLIERPVREGDWIEVGEHQGIVKKIAVRSTHIETFDRHQIIIPNSKLITEAVKNRSFTGGPARVIVPVGVAYGTDLDEAKAALLDVAANHAEVLVDPEPAVAMDGFGDSAIDLKLLAYVADVNRGAGVTSDLLLAIARNFAAKGIEIPFPQRDLNIRNWPQTGSEPKVTP